jgi:hypothetical protein
LFAYTGFRPQISLDETLREVIDYELLLCVASAAS